MKVKDILSLIDGKIILGEHKLNDELEYGFTSDLMSDVLTISNVDFILITGLCNAQTMRTMEMLDLQYVIFARGKEVTDDMIEIAKDNDILVMSSSYSSFRVSGILSQHGLSYVY